MCRGRDLLRAAPGRARLTRAPVNKRRPAQEPGPGRAFDLPVHPRSVNRSTAAGRSGAPVAYHHPQALLACDKFGGSARRQIGGLQTCISRQSLQSSKPPASSSRVPSHTNCASDRCAQRGAERGTPRPSHACLPVYVGAAGRPPRESKSDSLERFSGRESPTYQPEGQSIPRQEIRALRRFGVVAAELTGPTRINRLVRCWSTNSQYVGAYLQCTTF